MSEPKLQGVVAEALKRLAPGAPIAASIDEGVVTLTGGVENERRRIVIEQELLRIPEVLDVRNHLLVAAGPGDAHDQLAVLLAREGVTIPGLTAETRDGVLILSGAAATWFDRDAAERLAWTLPGIGAVENSIVLPPDAVKPDTDDTGDPVP